jgi:hypothetical protein
LQTGQNYFITSVQIIHFFGSCLREMGFEWAMAWEGEINKLNRYEYEQRKGEGDESSRVGWNWEDLGMGQNMATPQKGRQPKE